MISGNSVNISQCANGWIVVIPYFVSFPEDEFRKQARIMKEEFHGDDVLNKLREEELESNKAPVMKDENVFIFKTFDEVINFLNKKYGNKTSKST